DHRMTQIANPDRVRLTVLYLRLWKLCDLEFYETEQHDSAKHYDVVPIDRMKLSSELKMVAKSPLDWVKDPKEVRDEILHTLDLIAAIHESRTEKNLSGLDALRREFQKKAFESAGEIELASGARG